MKIAITGATGHIGINMTLAMVQKGYQVKILYRNPEKIKVFDGLNFEKTQGDVSDPSYLIKAFTGMDAVIHLAGVISIDGDPDGSVMKTNVHGTRMVVEACLKTRIKRLIHFSSVHALKYSNKSPVVNEKSPYADRRSFIYDQSKALGEREILKGAAQGLEAVILNPTAVIGPHDYFNSKSSELFRNLFAGNLPALVQGGFNWVDVRDIIAATLYILEKGAASPRYLLAGHWASFEQLATICQEVCGMRTPRLVLPIWAALLGLPIMRLVDSIAKNSPLYTYESLMIVKNANKNYNSELAEKELNYKVRPLKNTIEDIYEWQKRFLERKV